MSKNNHDRGLFIITLPTSNYIANNYQSILLKGKLTKLKVQNEIDFFSLYGEVVLVVVVVVSLSWLCVHSSSWLGNNF